MNIELVSAPVSYPWYKVWWQVLFHPSVKSYELILADPHAKAWRAILWVGIFSLLLALACMFLVQLNEPALLIVLPAFSISSLLIMSGGYHLTARLLKGSGTYRRMVYACGAFFAPVHPILWAFYFYFFEVLIVVFGLATPGVVNTESSSLLCGLLPVGLILNLSTIYHFVFAIKAAENITTGKAFLSWLIPNVVFTLLFGAICVYSIYIIFTNP